VIQFFIDCDLVTTKTGSVRFNSPSKRCNLAGKRFKVPKRALQLVRQPLPNAKQTFRTFGFWRTFNSLRTFQKVAAKLKRYMGVQDQGGVAISGLPSRTIGHSSADNLWIVRDDRPRTGRETFVDDQRPDLNRAAHCRPTPHRWTARPLMKRLHGDLKRLLGDWGTRVPFQNLPK
jgi:hypothetical protein